MNALVLFIMVAVTMAEYLSTNGFVPRLLKFTPEVLSAIAVLCIVALGARTRFQYVRVQYWLLFGAAAVVMICGVVANGESTGAVFAGMRTYLRAVPLFFLPAVYVFSERQIRTQLLVLLALCLPQFPIALNQRNSHLAMGGGTGDTTVGTLMGSGLLSIFLVCAACLLTGLYVRKRIAGIPFLALFILLLLPTTINETKATIILLPLGLLAVFILGSERGVRLRNTVIAAGLLTTFGAIFIPIYDYYISKVAYGTPIVSFLTDEKRLNGYMSHRNAGVGAGSLQEVGRLDSIVIPLNESLNDATRFAFGLGIGNASQSSLGEQFTGRYFNRYGAFLQTAASVFILEIGLFGLALVLGFFWLIYRDCRIVAGEGGLIGAIAAGWIGVIVVMGIATFYATLPASPALSYLFWYFSGLIAAHRMRCALAQTDAVSARERPSAALATSSP